jgi:hypothetical protein
VELFENTKSKSVVSFEYFQFDVAGDEVKNLKYTGRIFFIDGSKRH